VGYTVHVFEDLWRKSHRQIIPLSRPEQMDALSPFHLFAAGGGIERKRFGHPLPLYPRRVDFTDKFLLRRAMDYFRTSIEEEVVTIRQD
jgi:hypothetical protein